jgi:hypothetical protein
VPVACTSLLQRQLGWTDGVEVLVGDTAEEFAAACSTAYRDEATWRGLRDRALARVECDYSVASIEGALATALATAVPVPAPE